MTGGELYNVWRPMGGKYWDELDDFEQRRWELVAAAVRDYGDDRAAAAARPVKGWGAR